MTRSPYPTSSRVTTRPLELVHSDLAGPMRHLTHGKFQYFIILVDEYTDMYWAIPLRHKSDAQTAIRQWVARVENESGHKLGTFRSDNGGEYTSNNLVTYLKDRGVRHETSIAKHSPQNGKAERSIQYLVRTITSLLVDAGLSQRYWGEALNYALRIIERLPASAASPSHPKQRLASWTKRPIPPDNLHLFGCEAYLHNHDRYKFDKAGIKCRYLGPGEEMFGKKAHRLEQVVDGKIVFGRSVVFLDRGPKAWKSKTVEEKRGVREDEDDEREEGMEFIVEEDDSADGVAREAAPLSEAAGGSQDDRTEVEEEPNDDDRLEAGVPSVDEGEEVVGVHPQVDDDDRHLQEIPQIAQPTVPLRRTTRIPQLRKPTPPTVKRPLKDRWFNESYTTRILNVRHRRPPAEAPLPFSIKPPPIPNSSSPPPAPVRYQYEHALQTIHIGVRPFPKLPTSWKEAMAGPYKEEWMEATREEFASFDRLKAWAAITLQKMPKGKSIVSGRWVFALKKDPKDERTIRFKARFVARGYELRPGLDYFETFAPVCDATTRRLFFAIGASEGAYFRQGDVSTAFLTARLPEPVYMKPPPGFEIDPDGEPIVLEVHGAIYGLPQSPRAFNKAISAAFEKMELVASFADCCLYTGKRNGRQVALIIYVDDFVLQAPTKEIADELFEDIEEAYEIKDLGSLDPGRMLAVDVVRDKTTKTMTYSQVPYAKEILAKFDYLLEPYKTRSTVMVENLQLSVDDCPTTDAERAAMADFPHREILGSLQFLANNTRFDMSFAVGQCSRFQSNPGPTHKAAILDILYYLRGATNWGCVLGGRRPGEGLTLMTDSDWNGDVATSASTMGVMIFYDGSPIYWSSKKISSTQKSVLEAEFIAFAKGATQVEWILQVLADLGFQNIAAVPALCDNQGAIAVIKKGVHGSATRHIRTSIRIGFDLYTNGVIDPQWVPTNDNPADILTKALGTVKFRRFRKMGGLVEIDEGGKLEGEEGGRGGQKTRPTGGVLSG